MIAPSLALPRWGREYYDGLTGIGNSSVDRLVAFSSSPQRGEVGRGDFCLG